SSHAGVTKPIDLSSLKTIGLKRTRTEIEELDRVLGGGLVPGHVVLLAGEPGIGKSTLLLQVTQKCAPTWYVAGEESPIQIKIRADRLGISAESVQILDTTDVDVVLATLDDAVDAKTPPALIVVDSIQTIATRDLMGIPGSVGQVRECAHRLTR